MSSVYVLCLKTDYTAASGSLHRFSFTSAGSHILFPTAEFVATCFIVTLHQNEKNIYTVAPVKALKSYGGVFM